MAGHIKRLTEKGVKPEKLRIVVEAGRDTEDKRSRIKRVSCCLNYDIMRL